MLIFLTLYLRAVVVILQQFGRATWSRGNELRTKKRKVMGKKVFDVCIQEILTAKKLAKADVDGIRLLR